MTTYPIPAFQVLYDGASISGIAPAGFVHSVPDGTTGFSYVFDGATLGFRMGEEQEPFFHEFGFQDAGSTEVLRVGTPPSTAIAEILAGDLAGVSFFSYNDEFLRPVYFVQLGGAPIDPTDPGVQAALAGLIAAGPAGLQVPPSNPAPGDFIRYDELPGTTSTELDVLVGSDRDAEYRVGLGDDIARGGGGDDSIYGGRGADTLGGNTGDDYLDGGRGVDRLFGGTGDDLIVGGAGWDQAIGGTGSDTILGGAGADYLGGGKGADVIQGGVGEDFVSGGRGHDTLFGGRGADVIDGGAGNNVVFGGAGRDTFVLSVRGEMDVSDFELGEDIFDTYDLPVFAAEVLDAARQVGDDVVVEIAGLRLATIRNVTVEDLQANESFIDVLF